MTNGSQELVLFEKKHIIENSDLIPAYVRATEIKADATYLIGYIYEGRAIILYPTNGQNTQTKLVGSVEDMFTVSKNDITIKAIAKRTTKAVVGHVTYNITVKNPIIISNQITASAGSQHATTGNNSASAAVDAKSDNSNKFASKEYTSNRQCTPNIYCRKNLLHFT